MEAEGGSVRSKREMSGNMGLGGGKRSRGRGAVGRLSYLHTDHCVDEEQHHYQKSHIGQGLEGSTGDKVRPVGDG